MSFVNAKVIAANVSSESYRATDEKRGSVSYPMTRSELLSFAVCPRRWLRGYVRPESKALSYGSLLDCVVLQPESFSQRYIEVPATYQSTGMKCPSCESVTDAVTCRKCKCERVQVKIEKPWDWASSVCQEWKKSNAGKEPVKTDAMIEVSMAEHAIREVDGLGDMLRDAQKQVFCVAEWQDKATGITVPVKVLLDLVPDVAGPYGKLLFDLKSAKSAATRACQRDCFSYGYAAQAWLHSAVYNAATGEDRCSFAHIISESCSPFHVELDLLSVEFVNIGGAQIMAALALYCRSLARNEWPGYYAETVIDGYRLLQPEAFMLMAGDERRFPQDPEPAPAPDDERIDILT